MPKMPEERARESLTKALAETERLIRANEALAAIAQLPQWQPVRERMEDMIDYYVKAMVRESDPVEVYRLQGSVRALSNFRSSPEDALKLVEKLKARHDSMTKELSQAK
jgi:hypothetical protein